MILGVVCARKGSQGLPGKNLRRLGGVPLIELAIRKAWDAGCYDVVVCTDYTAADFDPGSAVILPRPDHLTGPLVSKWDVWRHVAERVPNAAVIVDVDVTRPLSTADTVRDCIQAVQYGSPAAIAVACSNKHPAFDIVNVFSGEAWPYAAGDLVARQQLAPTYQHAGCYAFLRPALLSRSGIFDGPLAAVHSPRRASFDIDDELDWQIVEALHRMEAA